MPSQAFPYIRLKDCGSLRSGQSLRKAAIEDAHSERFIIQTKDVLPDGRISTQLTPVTTVGEKLKSNVDPGDLLILSRGVRFNAGVVRELPGTSTALNMFYIFTPNNTELLPEFIAGFLNNPATQERLKRFATGATIPHLKADDLGRTRIPVPPLGQQRAYVALIEACLEEKRLLERLSTLRSQQLSAAVGFSNL